MINIAGKNKGAVLAALYNASGPVGMGFLQYDPKVMTPEEGQNIVDNRGDDATAMFGDNGSSKEHYFDYLKGRPLKIDIGPDEINPWGYDRDNGGDGAAERALKAAKIL